LADELGVSRATVRSVLAALAAERFIVRKQGNGTYVNQQVTEVNSSLGGLWDFSNIIENSGRKATIEGISIQPRPTTETETAWLNLPPGEMALEMVRLFRADNQPVVLSTNLIPTNLLAQNGSQFELSLPIHKFLIRYCHQEIAYVISDLSAALADTNVTKALQREPDIPLLRFAEIFYNADNQPLAFGLNYYDDKRLKLRLIQPWG
jgi:GntR family transcriptional regulator